MRLPQASDMNLWGRATRARPSRNCQPWLEGEKIRMASKYQRIGLGIALGAGVGAALGSALHMAAWLPIGIGIGLAIGSASGDRQACGPDQAPSQKAKS